MKKLMTMLAAVGMAFGLFADDGGVVGTPTSLEEGTLDTLWSNSEVAAIKAYDAEVTAYDGYDESGTDGKNQRYSEFDTQLKYLHVSSTFADPLYRWNEVKEDKPVSGAIVDGTCFDTLVQLVGVEDDEAPALAEGAKLAVWLKATLSEDYPDTAETNLYVTAGFKADGAADITAKPYPITNIPVEPGTWHRVTVKVINGAFNTTVPGFAVYIDGVLAQVVQDDYTIGSGFDQEEGTPYYNKQALFPSATADATFAGVGFAGNGNVDDISVTWGDKVPAFTAPAVKATIVADNVALTNFTYKIDDGAWVSVAVDGAYTFDIEDGQTVHFDYDYKFSADETATYAVTNIAATSFLKSAGGFKFNGGDNPALTIQVGKTDFEVVLRTPDGDFITGNTADAVLNYLNTPEGKTFVGTVNFLQKVETTTYSFPSGTTIAIDDGGAWTVTPGKGDFVFVETIENGKKIVINGDVTLGGLIKGGDPVRETTVTVNGTCYIAEEELTVDDSSDGAGAALIIGADGELDTTDGKIMLGANGRVVVPTAVTVANVFEAALEGKKIVPTEIKEEETVVAYQYNLVDLDQVQVTVVKTGAIVTGVETKTYAEGTEVNFKVAADEANGYTTPISVTKDDDEELTPNEDDKYSFTVSTESITITVTATLKTYDVNFWEDQKDGKKIGETLKVNHGAFVVAPAAPTKTGYTFTNWDPTTNAAITANADFVAQWNTNVYTITFMTNGQWAAETTYTFGDASSYQAPTVQGVEKWYTDTECKLEFVFSADVANNQMVYAKIDAPAPTPEIDPTKPSEPMSKDAADAAAAEINAHPEKYIKVPEAFGDIGQTALATYQTYFTAVVTGSGDNSRVELQLNTDGQTALQNKVDGEIVKIKPADIAAASGESITQTVDAIPGFYYGVKAGNGIGNMAIQDSVPAKGATVELTLPKFTTGAGFYSIVASPTPLK